MKRVELGQIELFPMHAQSSQILNKFLLYMETSTAEFKIDAFLITFLTKYIRLEGIFFSLLFLMSLQGTNGCVRLYSLYKLFFFFVFVCRLASIYNITWTPYLVP